MDLKKIYPSRNLWTHKGKHGYVLIAGGSKRYSGSPVFNAVSAMRAGADLAVCAGPARAMDIAAGFLPDMICHPLGGDFLKPDHVPFILELSEKFDALVLGCGAGRAPQTLSALREIIANLKKPAVIDADGIRAAAQEKNTLKGKSVVLTPHAVEFEILTGERAGFDTEDRKEKVKKWAERLGCVILLKGHIDVISDGSKIVLNETGSSYMTAGGLGDTLSGILGAILARGISPLEAAEAAAFINGKAGEMAAKKHEEGMIASDIFEFIPQVIKKYK